MKFLITAIFTTLINTCILFAQEDRVIAQIGDYKIYESEFSNRFDFSIHQIISSKADTLAVKRDFLNKLIAEKLLSLEAKYKGLDNSEVIRNLMTPLENMFVRDALYKKEIKDKTSFSKDDLSVGLDRIKSVLKLKFLYSNSEDEINELYRKLNSKQSFDSLLVLRPESKDQFKLQEITFGTMDKTTEDQVYLLKTGDYTKPIKSDQGYYILKLVEKIPNKNLKTTDNTLDDVKRIVESRAERNNYLKFHRDLFSKRKVIADKEIFEDLVNLIVSRFKQKYLDEKSTENNKYYLRGSELSDIYYSFNKNLVDNDFIKFENYGIKISYFLNQLSQEGLFVKAVNEEKIRASLSSYIRKFNEDEILSSEGKKLGLLKDKTVKKDINMWQDAYLAKMIMAALFDSIIVTETELKNIYGLNDWSSNLPDLVNIIKVSSDSLELIEVLLRELENGIDIRELALKYSNTDSVISNNVETGFISPLKLEGFEKIVSQMEIGDVYGPVKTIDGYSIIKLVERKPDTSKSNKSFEEVKLELKEKVVLTKFQDYVNHYNAKLADKYGVKINNDVVNSLDNNFLNLVVVRYMGFGGEIFAVPYTEQYSGWYDIWLNNQQKIQ